MFANLKQREKIVIAAGAAVVVLFLFWQLMLMPLLDDRKRLQNVWRYKNTSLAQLSKIKSEIDRFKEEKQHTQQRFGRRGRQFSLFSFVERSAGEAGLKDHIAYMKPSTKKNDQNGFNIAIVEVKLQNITLRQLVDYLHRIETSPNMVRIHRAAINKSVKPKDRLTVTMQVQTVTP